MSACKFSSKIKAALLLTVLVSAIAWAVEVDFTGSGNLKISSVGFKNSKGKAIASAYDRPEDFLKNHADRISAEINEGKAQFTFQDLPHGAYSLLIFHDENNNKKLDRNSLGMPTEAYGFSNDAREDHGPPKYSDAVIIFAPESSTLNIPVK